MALPSSAAGGVVAEEAWAVIPARPQLLAHPSAADFLLGVEFFDQLIEFLPVLQGFEPLIEFEKVDLPRRLRPEVVLPRQEIDGQCQMTCRQTVLVFEHSRVFAGQRLVQLQRGRAKLFWIRYGH